MNDALHPVPETGIPAEEKSESLGSFLWFLLKLALAVLIFRSFLFSPFSIPSESMLPRLANGDYLIAAKWPYGFTSNSLPFSAPLIPSSRKRSIDSSGPKSSSS